MNPKIGSPMKILWTDFASSVLANIYSYYRVEASLKVAKRIRSDVFKAVRQLEHHPQSGQIEETLKELGEDHRYLVVGNHKVVYKQIPEGILITDVFDTRQDPEKINAPERNPSK